MREFESFGEFADFLDRLAPIVPVVEHEALQQGAVIVAKAAKEMLGRGHPSWPPLSPETILAKEALGYPVPYPLLRTGDLQESIGFAFISPLFVEIGSNEAKAEWHELGTRDGHVPPRPFLSTAAIEKQDEVAALVGRGVYLVLIGTRAA